MSGSVTLFLESLHNVPAEGWTAAAYSVVRAGKVAAAPDYRVERAAHPGQDVLFCIAGAGFIETLGQRLEVRPGQLVWIANEEPHRHAAEPRDPWTVLWFRLDGPNPPALRQMLFGAEAPRIQFADDASPLLWFERLFATLRSRNFGLDLHLNQLVSEFLSIADRHVVGTTSDLPQPLARVVQAMRDNLRLTWNAEALTEITGLGASQTRRLFRRHLRTSPRQWLIRERLLEAQSLLMRETARVSEVAERCGFCDVYHFSREFKQFSGLPPTVWRRHEIGAVSSSAPLLGARNAGTGLE